MSGLQIDKVKAIGQAQTATGGTEPIKIHIAKEWQVLTEGGKDSNSVNLDAPSQKPSQNVAL